MKRILVATDLSPGSMNALARAIQLAAPTGASIRILHAIGRSASSDASMATRKRIIREVHAMAAAIAGHDLEFTLSISSRPAGEAIVRKAAKFGADLVLLGGHGELRFRDAIFGTTATYVVRHCDRPVLIVQNEDAAPYAKVMVALDHSGSAGPTLAATLAVAPVAQLFAVHAFDPPLAELFRGSKGVLEGELRERAEIEALLARLTGEDPRPAAASHALVAPGDVLTVLMGRFAELKPDLVAMGTRKHASFIGSHAVDTLYWCPNDILIVPEHVNAELDDPTPGAVVFA